MTKGRSYFLAAAAAVGGLALLGNRAQAEGTVSIPTSSGSTGS